VQRLVSCSIIHRPKMPLHLHKPEPAPGTSPGRVAPPHPWDVSHSAATVWRTGGTVTPMTQLSIEQAVGGMARAVAEGNRDEIVANSERVLYHGFDVPWADIKQYRREVEAATARLLEAVPATTSEDQ